MLTLVSSLLPANVSQAFIRHDVLPPGSISPALVPLSNWPDMVTCKLSITCNVVCIAALVTSLPVLTIHNGTLAEIVTWHCHLVLHTSAQISKQAAVLRNRDITLSNKVSPSEKVADWISIVTWLSMSLGRGWNPFEEGQRKQLLTISTCDKNVAMVWRCFLMLTLLYSHPCPFQLTTSQKACGTPQHCSMASKKNRPLCHHNPWCGHVVIWFWYPSCHDFNRHQMLFRCRPWSKNILLGCKKWPDWSEICFSIQTCGCLNLSSLKSHTM